jgi:hypothetical protein
MNVGMRDTGRPRDAAWRARATDEFAKKRSAANIIGYRGFVAWCNAENRLHAKEKAVAGYSCFIR